MPGSRRAVTRRTFVRLAASGLASALVPLWACAREVGQQRGTTHFPTPDAPLTPRDAWYFMAVQGAHEADLASYRLQVGGIAARDLSLSIGDLRARFSDVLELVTMACVGNRPGGGLISSALFRGVRVRDVMDAAGVDANRISGAMITGLDGFAAFQSKHELLRPESIFAFEMGTSEDDLASLPIDNGFPLRILTPGLYGYMQPKWLDTVTFVDQPEHEVLRRSINYFNGHIQLASGFSVPRGGTHPAPTDGPLEILGFAFGDGRPIGAVHVKIDGGPWQAAEIVWNQPDADDEPPYVWALWRFAWDAMPGAHQLTSRATYTDGETQIDGRSFPYSGGSLHTMTLTIEAPA
jgi:DMSO/TMAO reductase YedYZ molybdopterin-dependent catalytic subunit